MAKAIRGINVVIGAETTGLGKALDDVNKKSKDIAAELRKVETALKFNPKDTELLAQKQKLLGEQVATTREKLDRLKGAQEQVNEQFKRGEISEEQYRAFQREIVETESKLKHFEKQLRETGLTAEQLGKKLQDAGKKMTDIGKSLSMKVTAPIVGLGALIAKTGMEFEAAMSEVGAISGATGEDLAALEAKAKEMGATTKFSASEAAEGLKYMAMAGWDTQQQLAALPGVLNLAAASGEALGTVSDIVTDAMTAFGMEAARAGEFADTLAAAASSSNTNVSMLGESFKNVAPVAGALGYEAKDTAIALGLMANAGIKGGQAGTSMRSILTRLVKPTKESGTAMDRLGISLTTSEGEMKSLGDVMADLRGAFQDLDPDQQAFYAAQIAGQQGMSGLLAIVNAAEGDFNDLSSAINNSTGEAERMSAEMQDNLQGRLTELKSAVEGAALQLYDAMLPALEKIVEIVQKAVDWFADLSPGVKRIIVIVAGLVAAIGPLLIILGSIVSAIGTLIPLFGSIAGVIGAVTLPVVGVIAAIAALITVGVLLWKNWDRFKGFMIKIWGAISDFFSKTWGAIKGFFVDTWASIVDGVMRRVQKLKNFFSDLMLFFKGIFTGDMQLILESFNHLLLAVFGEKVTEKIMDVVWAVVEFLERIPEMVSQAVEWFKKLPEVLSKFFLDDLPYYLLYGIGAFLQFIGNTVVALYQWGRDVLRAIGEWLSKLPGRVWTWLTETAERIATWASDTWAAAKQAGRNFVEGAIEWISGLPERFAAWLTETIQRIKIWMLLQKLKARTAGREFVESVTEFIKTLPSRVWEWLVKTVNKIITWIGNIKTNAIKAGKQMLTSFVDEIKSLPGKLWDTLLEAAKKLLNIGGVLWDNAKRVASNMWRGFKDGLGISSPSYIERAMDDIAARAKELPGELKDEFGKLQKVFDGAALRAEIAEAAAPARTSRDVNLNIDFSGLPPHIDQRELKDYVRRVVKDPSVSRTIDEALAQNRRSVFAPQGAI